MYTEFCEPSECPVFTPTEEEFKDALQYIDKIRPIAEPYGIAKIRPPKNFKPPFAIEVRNFKFVPRTQRLNELGIHNRIKNDFLSKLTKFWILQGQNFKRPVVSGKLLDMYSLFECVKKLGGMDEVSKKKMWSNVCSNLNLPKSLSSKIHTHYERWLLAYEVLKKCEGCTTEAEKQHYLDLARNRSRKKTTTNKGNSYTANDYDVQSETIKIPKKRRSPVIPLIVDLQKNKELAKLQIFGAAGPNFVGLGVTHKSDEPSELQVKDSHEKANNLSASANKHKENLSEEKEEKLATIQKEANAVDANDNTKEKVAEIPKKKQEEVQKTRKSNRQSFTPYSVIASFDNCKVCGKDDNDLDLLVCDECSDCYHLKCLVLPLQSRPTGSWRCLKCVAKAISVKPQAYGFEQARKEYTLATFGEMADDFKAEHFQKAASLVRSDEVQREFWRLVDSEEDNMIVEYGADIHSIKKGSGFPRMCDQNRKKMTQDEINYAKHSWNLNNLPVLEQSLLRSISGDISGMKVPWVYVGMCFSAFCWHIEDHWTYSINYLHWGDPKTWYGVPRADAEKFEAVMHQSAPELFKHHPDLLHHLVTTINPNKLMQEGVRVVKADQCAGEFIITFPRAYHAGFNQGYNFAEAVNFCPADWIPVGRQCIEHYRKLSKCCVFSHEEIICKVALSYETIDAKLADYVYIDMLKLIQQETRLRENMKNLGVYKAEMSAFETIPDDERQCAHCNTTLFLSALTCNCTPKKLVCLHHIDKLCDECDPKNWTMKYRYEMHEFPAIISGLKERTECFETWCKNVAKIVDRTQPKCLLQEVQDAVRECEKERFKGVGDKLQSLKDIIQEASLCSKVALSLDRAWSPKSSATRTRHIPVSNRLTVQDLLAFKSQVENLRTQTNLTPKVEEMIAKVKRFDSDVKDALKRNEPITKETQELIERMKEFKDVIIPHTSKLEKALQISKWLDKVRKKMGFSIFDRPDIEKNHENVIKLCSADELELLIKEGENAPNHLAVEHSLQELQRIVDLARGWENSCFKILNKRLECSLNEAQSFLNKSQEIPCELKHYDQLKLMVKHANEWEIKAKQALNGNYYPYKHQVEQLIHQAQTIPFTLDSIDIFKEMSQKACEWLQEAQDNFMVPTRSNNLDLLSALWPKFSDDDIFNLRNNHLSSSELAELDSITKVKLRKNLDTNSEERPADDIRVFWEMAEKKEIEVMKQKRWKNDERSKANKSSIESNDDSGQESQFCICKKDTKGEMIQCESCHEWFHHVCIKSDLSKFNFYKSSFKNGISSLEFTYLCPMCQRTKRPGLTQILKLLLKLQNLNVRVKEGEALQFLVERAVRWKTKVIRYLQKNQKFQEYARTSTFKYSCKQKGLGSLQPYLIPDSFLNNIIKENGDQIEAAEALLSMNQISPSTSMHKTSSLDLECHEKTSPSFTKGNGDIKKSPKVEIKEEPCQNKVEAQLDVSTRAQLEEFLFEGNLIEVSIGERNLLWYILLQGKQPSKKIIRKNSNNDDSMSELSDKGDVKMEFEEDLSDESLVEVEDESPQCSQGTFNSFSQSTSEIASSEVSSVAIPSSKAASSKTNKKKKRKSEEALNESRRSTKKRKKSKTQTMTNAETEKSKIKSVKKKQKKQRKKAQLIKQVKEQVSSEDEDDQCAAVDQNGRPSCKHPDRNSSGEKDIPWICCDECGLWFHCACVGLTKKQADNINSYMCETCKTNMDNVDLNSAGEDD